MPPDLNHLPAELLLKIYRYLDEKTLKEISVLNQNHAILSAMVLAEKKHELALCIHRTLPPNLQELISVEDLNQFATEAPHYNLVNFLKKFRLLATDYNILAMSCFKLMWVSEKEDQPVPQVPDLKDFLMRDAQLHLKEIEKDWQRVSSFDKLGIGLSLTLYNTYLLRCVDPVTYPVFYFMTILMMIMNSGLVCACVEDGPEEARDLKKHLKGISISTYAECEYKKWVEFVYKEATSEQQEIIAFPTDKRAPAPDSFLAYISWFPSYLLFLCGPISLLFLNASIEFSLKLNQISDNFLDIQPNYFFTKLNEILFNLFHFESDPEFLADAFNTHMHVVCFICVFLLMVDTRNENDFINMQLHASLIILSAGLLFNGLKLLLHGASAALKQTEGCVSTVRTWLPGRRRIRESEVDLELGLALPTHPHMN